MDAAVAAARERLGAVAGVAPAARAWRDQDGVELVVQGGNGRWRQVRRARLNQWTPRMEARFLGELAACCNVLRACRAVGMSARSRRR